MSHYRICIPRGLRGFVHFQRLKKKVAEREGIEPTKPLTGFNGFENRGDHQAHSTLRGEVGLEMGLGQTNEWKN